MIYYLTDINYCQLSIKIQEDTVKFAFTKKIDNLGRIVIPKEMREYYGIKLNTNVDIIPVENGILIKRKHYAQKNESDKCSVVDYESVK